ncbi:alpha/beta hydrolase [Streptomyces sp. NPDC054794]
MTVVADEARRFNAELAARLSALPDLCETDDPVATREAEERGEAVIFPTPVRLPHASTASWGGVRVRVFTPPQAGGVYLHLHRGGWTLGSAALQDLRLWELAQAARVAVASVEYRLAPEHPYPAGPDDCETAARWLVEHAWDEFGTDRLVVGGESAGANLAVVTLLRLRQHGLSSAFRAAHLTYGAYDAALTPSCRNWGERNLVLSTPIMAWFYDKYLPGLSTEQRRAPDVSPLYADLRGLPLGRFVVGEEDPLLDDSLFMAARWRAAGNHVELDVVPDAAHCFVEFPIALAARERARQAAFLAAAVADA